MTVPIPLSPSDEWIDEIACRYATMTQSGWLFRGEQTLRDFAGELLASASIPEPPKVVDPEQTALPDLPLHIGQIVGTRLTPHDTDEFWGYWREGFRPTQKEEVYTADQMREYAREAVAALAAPEQTAALAELVSVRDLKDEIARLEAVGFSAEWKRLKTDYDLRKPLAWEAARAALATLSQAPEASVVPSETLYEPVCKMMAKLGMEGSITTRSDLVDAVMDALYELDGGEFSQALCATRLLSRMGSAPAAHPRPTEPQK